MTQDYIKKMALETIIEQQEETKIDDDKDSLLYLMAFNDGVIQLASKLQTKLQAERMTNEEELQEKFTREIEYANKDIDFTEGTDEEDYNRGYLGGLLCAYRVFFGKEYEEQEVHDE